MVVVSLETRCGGAGSVEKAREPGFAYREGVGAIKGSPENIRCGS